MSTAPRQSRPWNSNSIFANLTKLISGFLFLEDYDSQRAFIVDELRKRGYSNVFAPGTLEECEQALRSLDFSHAVLDYKLSDWVGKRSEYPVKACGNECENGVDIARYLRESRYNVKIVLFSTWRDRLLREFQKLAHRDEIDILDTSDSDGQNLVDHIISYIENAHQCKVNVKPLFDSEESLPYEIESYYAKKILGAFNSRQRFWKAGRHAWAAGSNEEPIDLGPKGQDKEEFGRNMTRTYELKCSKDGRRIELVSDDASNISINFDNAFEYARNFEKLDWTNRHFVIRGLCDNYLLTQTYFPKIAQFFHYTKDRTVVFKSMFECQKSLFKSLAKSKLFKSKEEIYDQLSEFNKEHFPQILDVFKCRVDSIDGDAAVVNFESYSPENIVRVERFSTRFLRSHHILTEDAQFEYTVYLTPLRGGSSYHIEPV